MGETKDPAILNRQHEAGRESDAVDGASNAENVKAPQQHGIRCPSRNDDAIGAADKNTSLYASGVNGNGLGNGHRAETAWIQDIDLATGGRLADRAGESLAWSGSATGIHIIPDTGNPSSGGLCHQLCGNGQENTSESDRRSQ